MQHTPWSPARREDRRKIIYWTLVEPPARRVPREAVHIFRSTINFREKLARRFQIVSPVFDDLTADALDFLFHVLRDLVRGERKATSGHCVNARRASRQGLGFLESPLVRQLYLVSHAHILPERRATIHRQAGWMMRSSRRRHPSRTGPLLRHGLENSLFAVDPAMALAVFAVPDIHRRVPDNVEDIVRRQRRLGRE